MQGRSHVRAHQHGYTQSPARVHVHVCMAKNNPMRVLTNTHTRSRLQSCLNLHVSHGSLAMMLVTSADILLSSQITWAGAEIQASHFSDCQTRNRTQHQLLTVQVLPESIPMFIRSYQTIVSKPTHTFDAHFKHGPIVTSVLRPGSVTQVVCVTKVLCVTKVFFCCSSILLGVKGRNSVLSVVRNDQTLTNQDVWFRTPPMAKFGKPYMQNHSHHVDSLMIKRPSRCPEHNL